MPLAEHCAIISPNEARGVSMDNSEMIRRNVDAVMERIEKAAQRSGRPADAITLIAVSKTVDAAMVSLAYEAGVRHFGENRAQELALKRYQLDLDCTWHFIGHLQSNKARDALANSHLIHSVDSVALAKEIDRRASAAGVKARILAQVNISNEESKSGINVADTEQFVVELSAFPNLEIQGLMTIAAPTADPEEVRPQFLTMKQAFDRIAGINHHHNVRMEHLSMGMSHDFEVAIEEGATMVRVGTAIFGARPPMRG